ncbi:MAG: hypothetical protein A3G40_09235 [Deltaproteobacteria bacterium RIFCSPLOWO2_12_FULL_57_22]|nr:MAG: hypothetical protein A3G40_09235 [Deltaproteobacteria bacterium RIFCSPLOWO2_12_FULL_57_22]
MEQITMFLWLITIAGVICCLFGLLFLASPHAVHKLNQGISRSILSVDTTFVKYNRYTGVSFLAIGTVLLYIVIRIL